jgi:hypothetical protein
MMREFFASEPSPFFRHGDGRDIETDPWTHEGRESIMGMIVEPGSTPDECILETDQISRSCRSSVDEDMHISRVLFYVPVHPSRHYR